MPLRHTAPPKILGLHAAQPREPAISMTGGKRVSTNVHQEVAPSASYVYPFYCLFKHQTLDWI